MEKIVKFETLSEGQNFCRSNPDYVLSVLNRHDGKNLISKTYYAYNKKLVPPVNRALVEHWAAEGLI